MLDDILEYLRQPFVVLSGTPVTALSIATAIGIVIAARIIAGVVARSAGRMFRARGGDHGLEFAIGKIIRYALTILGVFVAVSTIGVNMSAVLAAGAVLLVGIGFGLDVGAVLGTVHDIGLRATEVHSRDGITVFVPNAELVSGSVINHSVPTTTLRIWVKVGVAYGTDLDVVTKILLEVARAEPLVVDSPAPEVRHEGFGDSAIDLALLVWIAHAKDDLIALSKLRFAIDRAFRAHGITIPFPQRDVHLRQAS